MSDTQLIELQTRCCITLDAILIVCQRTNSRCLPENTEESTAIAIEKRGIYGTNVGTGAYDEQDNDE